MLNVDVNFGKSELQETECGLYRNNWSCRFKRTALFRAKSGRYEGGEIVVLKLFMCSWYQRERHCCVRRADGLQEHNS
jgi:hypothetical protein